eukprot:GDKI01038405.1.p1 GENE.GDKI01038405.1~~GDKI01038405.1.p1  ORF type:complete len:289 (-),score=88.04 GDKI01038405.1:275-1141(-)
MSLHSALRVLGGLIRLAIAYVDFKWIAILARFPFPGRVIPGPFQFLTVWNMAYHLAYFAYTGALSLAAAAHPDTKPSRTHKSNWLLLVLLGHSHVITLSFYGIRALMPHGIPIPDTFDPLMNIYSHLIVTLLLWVDLLLFAASSYRAHTIHKQKMANGVAQTANKPNTASATLAASSAVDALPHAYFNPSETDTFICITCVYVVAMANLISCRFLINGFWPYPFLAALEKTPCMWGFWVFALAVYWITQLLAGCFRWVLLRCQTRLHTPHSLTNDEADVPAAALGKTE